MQKVKIINPKHPHFGKIGTIKVSNGKVLVKKIGRKEMFEIEFIDRQSESKGCFVSRSDVELI